VNGKCVIAVLLLLGAALIVAAGRGPLWFDELLSLQWARSAQHPWHILELYRHDNNHPLNTLWLRSVGEDRHPLVYRGLSIFSGVLVLILVWIAARRLSAGFAWIPLALSATSFPLVLYSSEARGYSPALAFLLGAWLLVSSPTGKRPLCRAGLFWLLCLGALLSHGTSLIILPALGVYYLVDRQLRDARWKKTATGALLWFGPPLAVAVAYWFFFLRVMMVAGGPQYDLTTALGHYFGYAFGTPQAGLGPWIIALAGIVVSLAVVVFGRFPDNATRIFFACAVLVFPAASLLVGDHEHLYFRYFLVCLPFVYLLAAPAAEALANATPLWRISAALILGGCMAGQVPRLADLIERGRGDYAAALRKIATEPSAGRRIVANNEMQVGFILAHQKQTESLLKDLVLVPQARAAEVTADWIIYGTQDDPPVPADPHLELEGALYQFVSFHRSAPVSGSHWTVYRRLAGPAGEK
jgi:hypothetical protein